MNNSYKNMHAKFRLNKEQQKEEEKKKKWNSSGYSYKRRNTPKEHWNLVRRETIPHDETPMIRRYMNENEMWHRVLSAASNKSNIGVGAYIRVNILCQGDVFVSTGFSATGNTPGV